MRAFAVCLLTIGVLSVLGILAVESAVAKPGCNGLLAFSSNRAQDLLPQLYSIALDGKRTDLIPNFGPDVNLEPSPDGRKIAYAAAAGDVFVADADGSHLRALPLGGLGIANNGVVWSPDSRHLAVAGVIYFKTVPGNEVEVFDAATGTMTNVLDGSNPRWSPDGSTIAVNLYSAGSQTAAFLAQQDGTERQLHPGAVVAWSPDGTRLLGLDNSGTWVAPTAGGEPIEISNFNGIAWTPDGSRIIGTIGATTIESVAADGTDPRVIAENAIGQPVLSPDGRRVLFEVTGGHFIVADMGGFVRDLGPWTPPTMTFWRPRWSPDGSKVLFWSGGKVLVADANTGAIKKLAGGPRDMTGPPVWAPDGTVLDSISDATGNTDIYVSNPDGTGVRRVFGDAVPERHPVWSPDGKQIAFLRYGSPATLVVTNIAGPARTLLRDPGLARFAPTSYSALGVTGLGPPVWSPDGKTIAVASTTNAGIDFVDVRTGKARSFGTTDDAYPAFSPDGRSIAYATPNLNGGEDVVVAPRTRHGERSWRVHAGEVYSEEDQEPGLVEDIRWSPDGKRLSFIRFAQGEYGPFGYSTRTLDSHTHRIVAKSPLVFENSGFSPDGHFVAVPGIDTRIAHANGGTVATLNGLRSVEVSWQPLCKAMP